MDDGGNSGQSPLQLNRQLRSKGRSIALLMDNAGSVKTHTDEKYRKSKEFICIRVRITIEKLHF